METSVADCLGADLKPRDELASHNQRKHYERDIRFRSVDPDAEGQPLGVASYQFGPGGQHTAAVWKTQSQSLFDQDPTDAEHMCVWVVCGVVGAVLAWCHVCRFVSLFCFFSRRTP